LRELREPGAPTTTPADYVVWTTFHQSYSYEDFIEGIRPKADESGELSYPVVPGPLLELAKRAATQPDKKFVLVIDEINRGNIAKVFGELITLLEDDKRGTLSIRLPYSGQTFTVPPNLYVLGTMNTADRSIALLDVALRRRFAFVELRPQPELLAGTVVGGPEAEVALDALLSGLNARIRPHLGRDYEIGHSYLLKVKAAPTNRQAETLEFVWNNQIVPLLHEYFYSQPDKLRQVLAPFDEEEQALAEGSVASDFGRVSGEDLLFALQGLTAEQTSP
jgi:5-methylcytosine-specific restriction protein B